MERRISKFFGNRSHAVFIHHSNGEFMQSSLTFVGRVLVGVLFLLMALSKMGLITILGSYSDYIQFMEHYGVPLPQVAFFSALIIELLGALSLILGYRTRLFCYLLAAYLIPVTFFMHADFSDPVQFVKFTKNWAIIGSLIFIGSSASIGLSLDRVFKRN